MDSSDSQRNNLSLINRFYGVFDRIKKDATEIKSFSERHVLSSDPYNEEGLGNLNKVEGMAAGLRDSYNHELENLKELPKDIYQLLSSVDPIEIGFGSFSEVYSSLRITVMLISNCQAIVSALEPLIRNISEAEFLEASVLEGEFEAFRDSEKLLYNHLKEALDSVKSGYKIGPMLTAGKVASYVLDNIELDGTGVKLVQEFEKSGQHDEIEVKVKKDEERARILFEKKLIRAEDKDQFIRGIRKLRNAYTHNIEYVPTDTFEVLSFLHSASTLTKDLVELKRHK